MEPKIVTKDDIELFNTLRMMHKDEIFKREDLKNLLITELKYPAGEVFFMAIVSGTNPPIIQVDKGKYKFNPQPVYIQKLQNAFNDYAERVNKYYNDAKQKKKKPKIAVKSTTSNKSPKQDDDVDKAIKLLKSLGYRILAPDIKYVEI